MMSGLRCETTATRIATSERMPPSLARIGAIVAPPGVSYSVRQFVTLLTASLCRFLPSFQGVKVVLAAHGPQMDQAF